MAKDNKTNAMRKLDSMKIAYREHYYDPEAVNGVEVKLKSGIISHKLLVLVKMVLLHLCAILYKNLD